MAGPVETASAAPDAVAARLPSDMEAPEPEEESRPAGALGGEPGAPARGRSGERSVGPFPAADGADALRPGGCTAPQLRRFIKSRAYVPMHELRRRFSINGPEDEVSVVENDSGRFFIGLPLREGRMVADLVRQGEVGLELSLDPISPIVIGVYPMRPVSRG